MLTKLSVLSDFSAAKEKAKNRLDLTSQSSKIAFVRIIRELIKKNNYIFLGDLSINTGHSLEITEVYVDHMISLGYLRYGTEQEKTKNYINIESVIVFLVKCEEVNSFLNINNKFY